MQIFVLWRQLERATTPLDTDQVATRLQRKFSPWFDEPLTVTTRCATAANLVRLDLPVRGWKPPFVQEDGGIWSFAGHYPLNARAALGADAAGLADERLLPTLCRKLQEDPVPLLDALAPPFSLVWSSEASGDFHVQNDGLGCAQLFEYRDDRIWALTNKIFALPALDVPLRAVPEEWAARLTLGWFPMNLSGYEGLGYLPPATQLRIGSDGVRRKSFDVLSAWVDPDPMTTDDCLELARTSLLDYIAAAQPLWDEASVGLSGGWDSRAVVACLRARNAKFSLRVRGLPTRHDVVIARQLAEKAGLDLNVSPGGGLPPDSAEACQRSIRRALLWQGGYVVDDKYCSFLAKRPFLRGGRVNIMGQYGELGKPRYADRIKAKSLRPEQYVDWLIKKMLRRMPPCIREKLRDPARHIIATTFRQSERYGLTGLSALSFSYLYERCRRWAAASTNGQTGVAVTPFLNRDFFRAVFAFPGHDMTGHPFHRHIIKVHCPEWSDVPYSRQLSQKPTDPPQAASSLDPGGHRDWKQPVKNKKYDAELYWDQVARPVITDRLKSEGFWTEVFDPVLAADRWRDAPEQLAIALCLSQVLDGGTV
jgi:hypothetical protein